MYQESIVVVFVVLFVEREGAGGWKEGRRKGRNQKEV